MTVKQLREILQQFDENHPVVVKNQETYVESPVSCVTWDYDGLCKIIINKD